MESPHDVVFLRLMLGSSALGHRPRPGCPVICRKGSSSCTAAAPWAPEDRGVSQWVSEKQPLHTGGQEGVLLKCKPRPSKGFCLKSLKHSKQMEEYVTSEDERVL